MKEYRTQDGELLTYQYRPRKRKTAQMQIHSKEGLVLTVPNHWSEKDVEKMIENKLSWIRKARAKVSQTLEHRIQPDWQDGDHFLYLGRWIPVRWTLQVSGKPFLSLESDGFRLTHSPQNTEIQIRKLVVDWYRDAARQILERRVAHYSGRMGTIPEGIQVKDQKKRWGSCTSKKRVLLNWRLVCAPIEVLDGVVVHELCHITHMNHSKDFWNLVRKQLPDYDVGREWLRRYGHQLFWMEDQLYWRKSDE